MPIDNDNRLIVPSFFTQEELTFLAKWAERVYDKTSPKHIAAKNYIMNSLGSKTVYWSLQLVNKLKGFKTKNRRIWSQSGWVDTANGKRQIARFKTYTWARIYKSKDENRDIFFTVGTSGINKSLIYKLDYFREQDSKLSESQKELCMQLIPDEVSWIEIPFNEISSYNWKKLIDETLAFINKNEIIYDSIIRSVWDGVVNVPMLKNRLIKRDIPENGLDEIPKRTFNFQGVDVDWEGQSKNNNEIGKLGEELVIEYEKRKLKDNDKENYVKYVKKVKDGMGYDILSRNLDGTEKKIEVKTSTGKADKEFPISLQEIAFSELYSNSYSLYRVFNLNRSKNVAEFHEYKGNLNNHFLFEGTQFNAHRKRIK